MKRGGVAIVLCCAVLTLGACGSEDTAAPIEVVDTPSGNALLDGAGKAQTTACLTEAATLKTAWAAADATSLSGAPWNPYEFLADPFAIEYFGLPADPHVGERRIARIRLERVSEADCPSPEVDDLTS